MRYRLALLGLVPLVIAACSQADTENRQSSRTGTKLPDISMADPDSASASRWYQFQHVSAGARVFQENCASCHGKQAEGAVNWRQPTQEKPYPAPPLNGTGHAWHHPLKMLVHVVRNGSPGGQGGMPAWNGKLSNEEILSVIAWLQSRWPKDIYQAWNERDSASRRQRGTS